jgi:tetratricopeptide (TPR) repeat protein
VVSCDDPRYREHLVDLIKLDLEFRWKTFGRRSDPPTFDSSAWLLEDYVARYPELGPLDWLPDDLIAEEYRARGRWGDRPERSTLTAKFPDRPDLDPLLAQVDQETAAEAVRAAGAVEVGGNGRRFGEYELFEALGEGGMGTVYRARDTRLGRIVALKVIRSGRFASQYERARLRSEARSQALLDHPNLVTLFAYGECEGLPFLAMKLVRGRPLSKILEDAGPLDAETAACYTQRIAESIQHAHDHNVIHRDLKPSNILIEEGGQPQITDFGLAKRTVAETKLTETGEFLGTLAFMPPEQARGRAREVGCAADVYSIGATLFAMLAARPPFQSDTFEDTRWQVLYKDPPSLRQFASDVPADLETICLKCLEKEPSKRYATARELADDLARFRERRRIVGRRVSRVGRVVRWYRRNPVIAWSATTVFLTLVTALVAVSIALYRTELARIQAEKDYQVGHAALDKMFVYLSDTVLLNRPGVQAEREEILRQAESIATELVRNCENDPRREEDHADMHYRLGRILELERKYPEAEASLLEARCILLRLGLSQGWTDDTRMDLSNVLTTLGSCALVGNRRRGSEVKASACRQALNHHQEARSIRGQLCQADPANSERKRKLASTYMNVAAIREELGDVAVAVQDINRAQTIRLEELAKPTLGESTKQLFERDLAMGEHELGRIYIAYQVKQHATREDPLALAVKHFSKASALFKELTKSPDRDVKNEFNYALTEKMLGGILARQGMELRTQAERRNQLEQGREHLRKAEGLLARLIDADPDVKDYTTELQKQRAAVQELVGRIDRALEPPPPGASSKSPTPVPAE